jgi:hypothetical protein
MHSLLPSCLQALNIRDIPPRVASSDHAWLGDRPKYY